MRIMTWNCNMAFRNKKDNVLKYDPDLLVIQECENPELKGEWHEFGNWVWIGDNKNKGLGVFARNGINVEIMNNVEHDVGRYIVPIKITGLEEMTLIAVWAMNDTDHKKRYIGQVFSALQVYRDSLGSQSIVIGDFNWNAIWDNTSNSLYGNLADTVAIFKEIGLTSVYHDLNNCNYGSECTPTFYMHKKRNKPYHIDYIFISQELLKRIDHFWVGEYEDWIKVSDHVPMMLELIDETS